MIGKSAYYLPEGLLSNGMLEEEFSDFSAKKIEKKVGIRNRHLAAPGETVLDMAVRAGEKVLDGFERSKIDFLLLCTQSPDYPLPGTSSLLQSRLGLSTGVGAFDFNLGCSGFVYGLAVAKGLLAGGVAEHILLITAETYSRYLDPSDKGNRSIFGDAAAAVILEADSLFDVGEFVLGTDGRGAENLIVRGGGGRARADGESGSPFLYMNGPEIFSFTIETVPALVEKTLERNRLVPDDIDHYVFHQANKYMLRYLQEKLGVEDSRFHIDLAETGNTVSSSIPILLHKLQAENVFRSGERILIAGFGVGYSYGATVLTCRQRQK
ncbi:MAG: ketoacyl-ACP synthase III [Lentisphaeria bacterium]|nr:ketoacyl-ACP synthase III [Lentisphaeria bacterium]